MSTKVVSEKATFIPGSNVNSQALVIGINSLIRFLVSILFFLVLAHAISLMVLQKYPDNHLPKMFFRLFNLDTEGNISVFFNSLLLLFSSLLLILVSIQFPHYKTKWRVLGMVFLFLCLDEIAGIHEESVETVRSRFLKDGSNDLGGLLYFSWVVPYFLLLIGVGLYFFNLIKTLPKKTLRLFILSAIIYVGGALVCELFEARIAKNNLTEDSWIRTTSWWVLVTLEETMEMTGLIVFIYALLDYLQTSKKGILNISFGRK